MPIFGEASSPYDEIVEKATAENLTTENWALMMDISDNVLAKDQRACKDCLVSLKKRLNHRDPHVVLLTLSLLDCLWNNCSDSFRREVSSKEFISELNYRATNSNRIIGQRARALIKKWCDNECKTDTSLSLIESLYRDLVTSGYTFESTDKPEKKMPSFSNDLNVVTTDQEEADIAKAIALSLNDVKDNKKQSQTIYPSSLDSSTSNFLNSNNLTTRAQIQVKALYDFEAAEDNELSFTTGELITVLDDSDQNWWRGSSAKGSGLFPASFVTRNLNSPVNYTNKNQNGNSHSIQEQSKQLQKVDIDEEILLKCFQLLQDCDPTGETPDSADLAYYEQMSLAQATLIDQKLTQIDKQHNMLAQIDVAIRDVLANYDNAVQHVQFQMQQAYVAPNPVQSTPSFLYSTTPVTPTQIQTSLGQVPYTPTQGHQQTQNLNPVIGFTTIEPNFPTPSSNQRPFL